MFSIAFIDTEIHPKSGRILDIGGVKGDGSSFHSNSVADFIEFMEGSQYICGHNIFNHDLKYVQAAVKASDINESNVLILCFIHHFYFQPKHIMLSSRTISCKLKISTIP